MSNFEYLLNTALLAISSAVLAGLIGFIIAPWLQTLNHSRRWVQVLLLVPFVLPSFLIGITLIPFQNILSYSNLGILWIVLAHLIMNVGFVATTIASNPTDGELIEEAMVSGASRRQIRTLIELPLLIPKLTPTLLLVALYSATSYGLVASLGQGFKTLETQIALKALRELDLNQASILAILQTILTLGLFAVASKLSKPVPGNNERVILTHRNLTLSRWTSLTWLFIIAVVLFSVIVRPMQGSGVVANLMALGSRGYRDILNLSVLDATANSIRNLLVTLLVSIPLAWLLSSSKKSRFWEILPIGISPVVWGLSFLILSGYLPRVISSSWLLLPLVQVLFAAPLLTQLLRPARLSIENDLLHAGALDGANRFQLFRFLEFPLIWPTARIAIAISSLASIGEFGAASFLAIGDQATLPIVMFRLISRPGLENFSIAMTAAALFILFAAYIVWIASRDIRNLRQLI